MFEQLILKYYKNRNRLQFLFVAKAAALNSKYQIQITKASYHIYFSQRPFRNVKSGFCA